MDLTPVLVSAITATVAILSTWLTARYAARAEDRRIVTEENRARAEHERELEKMRREDADRLRAEDHERRAQAESLSTEIAEWFLSELRTLRAFQEVDEDSFNSWYTERWSSDSEVELRRLVGRVRTNDDRNRLVEVIDALANFVALAEWRWTTGRTEIDRFLTLGFDMAATMFREQALDEALDQRLSNLRKDVFGLAENERELREARREALRKKAAEIGN